MTASDIVQIVCEVCGITPEDLKKRSRKEDIFTARALIAHFLYRKLNMMPREISGLIGHMGVSRTSVYHCLPNKHTRNKTLVEDRSPHQKELQKKAEIVKSILCSREEVPTS